MLSADNKLNTERIPKLVISYALTTFIALILNSVYSLTDALFVSWGVGANASGAISVVMPFVIIQSAISTAIGGGAATLVSIKFGEGKPNEAGEITFNAMIAFYSTALFITAVGFMFMEPMLKIMGVTGDLYSYAKTYFIIILAGNVFSTGFSSIIRAEGKMVYGMLIWVIPITINIALDAVFILILKWNVKGAALATVACQFTSFLMMVLFFCKFTRQSFVKVKLKIKHLANIISVGTPSLVQIGTMSVIMLIINFALSKAEGTNGINTFAFVSKLITFAIVPFTALTQAIMPIIGFNYGCGNNARIKETIRFSICLALAYAVIATAVAEIIPIYLMRMFTNDTEIINTGVTAIRILSISLVFTPLPLLIGAAYQAQGFKSSSLLLYSLNLLFLLPFVFTLYIPMGINGVWLSYLLSTVCAAIFTVVLLIIKKARSVNLKS